MIVARYVALHWNPSFPGIECLLPATVTALRCISLKSILPRLLLFAPTQISLIITSNKGRLIASGLHPYHPAEKYMPHATYARSSDLRPRRGRRPLRLLERLQLRQSGRVGNHDRPTPCGRVGGAGGDGSGWSALSGRPRAPPTPPRLGTVGRRRPAVGLQRNWVGGAAARHAAAAAAAAPPRRHRRGSGRWDAGAQRWVGGAA